MLVLSLSYLYTAARMRRSGKEFCQNLLKAANRDGCLLSYCSWEPVGSQAVYGRSNMKGQDKKCPELLATNILTSPFLVI